MAGSIIEVDPVKMTPNTMADFYPSAVKDLNLAEKLSEACAAVSFVEKHGRNEMQSYDYVKAADVAKAIRMELFNRGIMIIPTETELQTERFQTNKGGYMTEVRVKTAFVITDGKDKLEGAGWGIARDSGDKAIYKAKTGALKYFLRGLGLIPDEKDDPETDTGIVEHIDKHEKAFEEREAAQEESLGPKPDGRIPAFKVNAIMEACQATGKSELIISAHLAEIGAGPQLEYLTNAQFQDFLKWASTRQAQPQELEQPLKRSLGAVGACPDCGKRMVPAGISKKPKTMGKPYPAFCGNKDCPGKQKPQRLPKDRTEPPYDEDVPF